MPKRRIVQTLLLLLVISKAFGQDHVTSYEVNLQQKTPQSPNAGSLGKHLDFPVNMATGVPNIAIPLYTVKIGDITVPITLTYHAGGIKVNDKAGWVGLGWNLDAGGSVVKKTNGLDDIYLTSGTSNITPMQDYLHPDYQNVPYNRGYTNMTDAVNGFINGQWPELTLDSNLRFMGRILVGQNDGEADDFLYSTPDGSGKFYYNQKLAKFQTNKTNGYIVTGDTTQWTLYSPNGLRYGFGRLEHTLNPLYQRSLSTQANLITAWHLTVISDVVNDKGVIFDYDNYYTTNVYDGYTETNDYRLIGPLTLNSAGGEEIKRTGDNYVLKKIQSGEGTINFIKDTAARQDGAGPHALKEIQIYNKDSLLLKKFLFSYYYTVADSGCGQAGSVPKRLILNSLQEVDYDETGTSHARPPYYFKYDTTVKLPCRISFAQDKWGYYNGKLSNTSGIPHNPYFQYYSSIVGADRNVDSNYSKAGTLNGIVYPTGGKAVFEYESNRAWSDSVLVGGLRVKKITYYDSVAQSGMVTEYRYPSVYNYWTPTFWYQVTECSDFTIYNNLYAFDFMPLLRVESEPIAPSFFNQGAPGYYPVVEKVEKSAQGDLLSKHYFTGYQEPITFYENIMGVPHEKVTETSDILESGTEIYKRETGGSYTLIQTNSTTHGTLENTEDYVWNIRGAWNWDQSEWCEWPGGDPFIYGIGYMIFNISPSMQAYKVHPSQVVKTGQTNSTITTAGTLNQYSFYEHDSTNGNLKITKEVDSKGDTTIQLIKYTADFPITGAVSGANHEIDTLLLHNVQSAPVEILTLLKKKDSTNSTVQSAVLYEYENLKIKKVYKVFGTVPFGSFTQSSDDASGFYKDSRYSLYQEVTSTDVYKNHTTVLTQGNKESYIWEEDYLLAKTANAANAETAFSSFESNQKGNWIYSGSTSSDNTAPTGKKVYHLNGGNITASGLSSNTYIVSYWGKNGSVNVNSAGPTRTGKTIGDWVYYEHEITGTSITVSGSKYIDELRLLPKGALMTTFTYFPAVGMRSQCDINNRIQYFDYDAPGRLILVRDEDRNVLKKICYNYAGQPTDCLICTDTTATWVNTATSPRCQQNSCGNTGYLEQEQVNTNRCNSTYNQTQWVVSGYDTTTCSLASIINITYNNIAGVSGWRAAYTNTSTSQVYAFDIPSSGTGTLGCIPAGSYTLAITKHGYNGGLLDFSNGCTTVSGTWGNFSSFTPTATTCRSAIIDFGF